MTNERKRQIRQQFTSAVRISLDGQEDFLERFASNMSTGGMFIPSATPAAVGSILNIEFVLPNGAPLSRVSGRVVRAKPATTSEDETAGMAVEFIALDKAAKTAAEVFEETNTEAGGTAEDGPTKTSESLLAPEEQDPRVPEGPVVGIDLGTTNSCVACVVDGEPTVLTGRGGYEAIPSVIFVTEDRKVLVGHKAVERMVLNSRRAVYGSKRFIGRRFVSKEVHAFGKFFHYDLTPGKGGRVGAAVDGTALPLEVVSAYLLSHLRQLASDALGCDVHRCVLTVPAYFGEAQRQSVRDAARLSGLYIERLLSEPTAAAVAYGYGRGRLCTVLVYDLGGGTFDVSVLNLVDDQMTVLATDGDPFLGGSDFDDRLTEYALSVLERDHGIDGRSDDVVVQRVRFAVELAKRQLTEAESAVIDLPYLTQGKDGWVSPRMHVTRDMFESLTEDLVQRTLERIDAVLFQAKLKPHEINGILLVGGQSRSPHVRRALTDRFGELPSRNIHPDHAVALGAAIVGEATRNKLPVTLTDVLPASIRHATHDGDTEVVLPRGRPLPAGAIVEVPITKAAEPYFEATLCRGELEKADDNEVLGTVTMPATEEDAASGRKASLAVRISADGLLQATLRHPQSGEVKRLELRIPEAEDPADLLEFHDLDLFDELDLEGA